MSRTDLIEAIVAWSSARKLRCPSCDEGGDASPPCTCFDVIAALEKAEARLQEIADASGPWPKLP